MKTAAERALEVASLLKDFVEIGDDWEGNGPEGRVRIHTALDRCIAELQGIQEAIPVFSSETMQALASARAEDSAWLCARIRNRLREIAEAHGKPELTSLSGEIVETFQDVLDGHGWAITRSGMLREDAPWLRLTWPSNGRELRRK